MPRKTHKPTAQRVPQALVGSTGGFDSDPSEDPKYQAWLEELAKECKCWPDCPCGGLMAGGLCDELDLRDDEETADERYDLDVWGDEWHTPMSL
jgi:hypothetical protein